ncbi:MAG: HD-GYP domain-containing protein, partial [bacterium]
RSLSLGVMDEVLVFEGVPFYSSHVAIKEIQTRLEERNITAVEIFEGLTMAEFTAFIKLLMEPPAEFKEEGNLCHVLRKRGIHNIVSKDVKEVYSSAIEAVGEVLQEARLGKIPRADKSKAAVADLKRFVLSDHPALLALTLIKSYDTYLFNHSVNVSVLSLALAHGMGIPEDDVSDIGLAGLLHDIGKTITPKGIILKPGKLDDDEWKVMREHPEKGAEIVSKMEGVGELVTRLVKEHHVNFDMNGYPELAPGETPHSYSKILTVADCYDAITTLRPYQKPFHPREAMKIMENLSGKVIDPKYYEEFVKVLGIYPIGSLVRLDSNEVAVVLETFAEAPLSPRIKVIFDESGNPLARTKEMDLSNPDSYPGENRFIVSTIDPILYNVDPLSMM